MPISTTAAFDVIRRSSREANPSRAIEALFRDCVSMTNAATGRLYLLRLADSAYSVFSQVGPSDEGPSIDVSLFDKVANGPTSVIEQSIIERAPRRVSRIDQHSLSRRPTEEPISRLIVPIVRESACLGAIVLGSPESDHFTEEHTEFVSTVAYVMLLLREKEDTIALLNALRQPIDFTQPFEDFLDDVILLIADASGMPFIVLRELDDEQTLRCIASYGFPDVSKADLDLSPVRDFPSFYDAVTQGKTVVEADTKGDPLFSMRKARGLTDTRSFLVTPVKVGTSTFGTLSFGARCPYNYTTIERTGFENIANAVGITIANYRNFHRSRKSLFELAEVSVGITTVEVAQAARHEARNYLQEVQDGLAVIGRLCNEPTTKNLQVIRELIDGVSKNLVDVGLSLDKIKDVTRPPAVEVAKSSIKQLWTEAFTLVAGRLAATKVRYIIVGPDCEAMVYADYVRHAFLNLIINSIDAFKDRRIRHGRAITVTIEPPDKSSTDTRLRYADNASGIDPSKLRPALAAGVRAASDIFEPGVTSKDDGSGYGLFLVRRILARHGGSITLVNYRNGVTFEIRLPKGLACP